jgi:transposase InsO family protein
MKETAKGWRLRWEFRFRVVGWSASSTRLVARHGRPSAVRVDYGPEFTAQPFVDWCAEHAVAMHYIQPEKPDQNAYIERFNRSYRTEVLKCAPL